MHVKYQLNQDNWVVKTMNTKKLKLHKFATCNSNFEKSLLSDMHYLTPDIRPNLRSMSLLDIV